MKDFGLSDKPFDNTTLGSNSKMFHILNAACIGNVMKTWTTQSFYGRKLERNEPSPRLVGPEYWWEEEEKEEEKITAANNTRAKRRPRPIVPPNNDCKFGKHQTCQKLHGFCPKWSLNGRTYAIIHRADITYIARAFRIHATKVAQRRRTLYKKKNNSRRSSGAAWRCKISLQKAECLLKFAANIEKTDFKHLLK